MKAAPDDNIFSSGNIVTRLLTIPGFDSRLGEEFFVVTIPVTALGSDQSPVCMYLSLFAWG
jgi:hypothetical protein